MPPKSKKRNGKKASKDPPPAKDTGSDDNDDEVMNDANSTTASDDNGETSNLKSTEEDEEGNSSDEDMEAAEEEEEENEEDDDDEVMDDDEDEGDEEIVDGKAATPPSQSKKDMRLRSGRRKRRRSKETTGLTPPESSKRSRTAKSTTTARKRQQQQMNETATRSSRRQAGTMNGESTSTAAAVASAAEEDEAGDETMESSAGQLPTDTSTSVSAESPVATGLDPRRISYSQTGVPAATSAAASSSRTAPTGATMSEGVDDEENEVDEDTILNLPPAATENGTSSGRPPRPSASTYLASITGGVVAVVAGGNATTAVMAASTTTVTTAVDSGVSSAQEQDERASPEETDQEATDETVDETTARKLVRRAEPYAGVIFRLSFMAMLSLLFFVVWPKVVHVAVFLVPLDKQLLEPIDPLLPDQEPGIITDSNDAVVMVDTDSNDSEDDVVSVVDPPSAKIQEFNFRFLEDWSKINEATKKYGVASDTIVKQHDSWIASMGKMRRDIDLRKDEIRTQIKLMKKLNSLLLRYNQGSKLSTEEMSRLRSSSLNLTGVPLFQTSQIDLWEIPLFNSTCTIVDDQETDDDAELADEADEAELEALPTLASLEMLEKRSSDLSLRARMSADKFKTGEVTKRAIREWVKTRISNGLEEVPYAGNTMEELERLYTDPGIVGNSVGTAGGALTVGPGGGLHTQSILQIEALIRESLEVDRADKTKTYDHASISNGASVIYGGKRGTSRSLIDDLPLVNRLLRHAGLRSYGFGPEAALIPTYPPNSLGQCWSFRTLTLDEQIKEREEFEMDGLYSAVPDDFKRGSVGTLTIRFAEPVNVRSVVIENLIKQANGGREVKTAIRSFRVVGYEDENALTKAWNLGSYKYDRLANWGGQYLQEFKVPTSIAGKDVPKLGSISVAIDANMGGAYTCMYRFRVHGEEEYNDE